MESGLDRARRNYREAFVNGTDGEQQVVPARILATALEANGDTHAARQVAAIASPEHRAGGTDHVPADESYDCDM